MKISKIKTLRFSLSQLKQHMLWQFMFIFPVHVGKAGYSTILYLLDYVFGGYGAMSEKFSCNSVDDNWDGLNI